MVDPLPNSLQYLDPIVDRYRNELRSDPELLNLPDSDIVAYLVMRAKYEPQTRTQPGGDNRETDDDQDDDAGTHVSDRSDHSAAHRRGKAPITPFPQTIPFEVYENSKDRRWIEQALTNPVSLLGTDWSDVVMHTEETWRKVHMHSNSNRTPSNTTLADAKLHVPKQLKSLDAHEAARAYMTIGT